MHRQVTFLALGDSYTIGEALPLYQSFPYQTVQLLRTAGFDMCAPEIIAKTGWTSEDLLAALGDYRFPAKYDFVTLLTGVNNQYKGQEIIRYKEEFESLLNRSLELAAGKKDHVFVCSIPDYSLTPFAANKDGETISKELDEYNKLNKAISIQYKVPYIDVTTAFREAESKSGLLAEDGLHPSQQEYRQWAKQLAEAMAKLLKK